MKRASLLWIGLAMVVSMRPVHAQDYGDFAAYIALSFTSTGGFVPLPTAARMGEAGGAISIRYGQFSFDDDAAFHNIGVSGDFRAGAGRLGITGGALVCSGCDPIIMLGGDWTALLTQSVSETGTFSVGLTTAAGVGIPTEDADGVFASASLGLPLSMIAGKADGLRVVPYVTPAVGFGAITGDGGDSGIRPMLGGGLGIVAASGLGISAGFQKVFIEDGETIIGLAVTFGRSGR
ncbi:MAG: hypothetical protein M3125_05955 [Gemmatimonadota bacterium]|nr:hypothetical protein [Gemmatimonadota bacterium]